MAEVINTNVFDAEKKFVDFAGLDYFWEKAKSYVDGIDAAIVARVSANEGEIATIKAELSTLNGGVGSIGDQIDAKISALKLPETYEAKGDAAKAEAAAKAYADAEIAKLSFDEAGTAKSLADAAEAAAKSYADGLAVNYDAAGTAAGLNSAMDVRVKALEALDHNKIAADAASAAVAGVIDEAPEKFDTLKEIADWISNSESAADAANLVTRVADLEAIDHNAYVAADETVLASAKSYADGKVDGKFDAVGAAEAAENAAKAYADDEIAKLSFDAAGTAAGLNSAMDVRVKALEAIDHNAYVAADETVLASAKSYADGLASNYEVAGAAANAQAAAIAQAKVDAADALKAYYTKTEVDNLLSTNSTGDRAYAKQYTDELFGSFKFAANSDIDALFAPKAE